MKTVNVVEQEQTYKWIQERLRQLHSGTLSEEDRRRLMEIAEHDPFVADALEGYTTHPDGEHAEYLEYLSEKITHHKRERRRWLIPNLTITAIAASLLIIIATYAVITRMEKKTDETLFVFVAPDSLPQHDSMIFNRMENNDIVGNNAENDRAVAASASQEPTGSSSSPPSLEQSKPASSVESKSSKESMPGRPSGAMATADHPANQPAAPMAKAASPVPEQPTGFESYVKGHSRYPLATAETKNKKTVTISFRVSSQGKLSDFVVTQSSGNASLDNEAIRLIQQGPAWDCGATEYPCTRTCAISFK